MALDTTAIKSHAAVVLVVLVTLAAVIGCWAFVVSLQPCRVRLESGTLVSYTLSTEFREIGPNGERGPARIEERPIDLLCIGDDNEVALVSAGSGGAAGDVCLMKFAPDGTARRVDADAHLGDEGKAIGFFDFNLLPLPPKSEQAWNVSLLYSLPPPDKRQVTAKVKRLSSSGHPEFQLKLSRPLEWLNSSNRWLQVRDLTCTYRFDTHRGVIERAELHLIAGIEHERDQDIQRFDVTSRLAYVGSERLHDDGATVRDLCLASADAQSALDGRRYDRLAPLLARLDTLSVRDPRLRQLVAGVRARAAQVSGHAQQPQREAPRVPPPPPATPTRWAIRITPASSARGGADRLTRTLVAAGLPAQTVTQNTQRVVMVGPYPAQDAALLARVTRAVPGQRIGWMKL